MWKLLADAEELLPFWTTMQHRLEAVRQASYSSLSTDERRYFDLLTRYVEEVNKTIAALVERQRLLNEGSKGGARNLMRWEAFQQRERAYQRAIEGYMSIGQELNDAAPLVFER